MQSQREAQRAGKTATAQTGWYDGEREILHTWFAGYFPAEEPEYAIVVLKEDGSSGATDGRAGIQRDCAGNQPDESPGALTRAVGKMLCICPQPLF